MSIAGQCPGCNRKFAVPDHFAGKSVRCPQCSRSFLIGAASPISAGAPPVRPPASFQLADASAGTAGSAPPVSGGSKKRLLLIGGIGAAGFMVLLCMGLGVGAYLYFGGGGTGQWKEFAPSGGGFSVLMPGAPVQKDRNDTKVVSVTPIHEAVAQPAKISYSVEYYDLAGRPINDYLYLSWLKNQLLADGGKLAREKDIALSPYGGKEIVVKLSNNQVLVRRVYLAEARVFWVSAQYPDTPVPPTEIQKFLDSFKITSVAKAPAAPTVVADTPKSKDPATKKKSDRPATKKDPDPPMAKKDSDPPPAKVDFPVSADENTVVAAINRFREGQKVRLLTLDKQLFDIARANAQADVQGRPSQRAKVQGYSSTFRLAISGARGQTPQQLVDDILKSNFRNQLTDAGLKGVGVGLAVDNNGFTRYVMIFGKAN